MSNITLPGSPECIAVLVRSDEMQNVRIGRHEEDDSLCILYQDLFGNKESIAIPDHCQWEIIGLASELVKHEEKAKLLFENPNILYSMRSSCKIALLWKFKAADLDPEKEYVILRKTN